MELYRKIVVLSGLEKGVLKIEKMGERVTGSLNLMRLPKGRATLAIKCAEQEVQLFEGIGNRYSFSLRDGSDITAIAVCVVDDKLAIMTSGSTERRADYASVLSEIDKSLQKSDLTEEIPVEEDGLSQDFSGANELEANDIYGEIDAEDIISVRVTDAQETGADISEEIAVDLNERIISAEDSEEAPFYIKVKEKLDMLFDDYPHEKQLEELVHSSSWARVQYDDDNYYVVGVIRDEGEPQFICYGTPAERRGNPLPELRESCEWLPLDRDMPDGRGYWMLYQDALTGKTIC